MAKTNRTSAAAARALLHQGQALDLRRAGLSYREIAARMGIGKSHAHALVRAGIDGARAQVAGSSDELLALELSRLDGMLAKLWPKAAECDLQAVDRVLKIIERRARLLGLDAPTRTAIQGGGDDTPFSAVTETRVTFYVPHTGREKGFCSL